MVSSNDLRVGNKIFNGTITEVRQDGFKFSDGFQTWDSKDIRSEAIEGLPLTVDLLEKAGFKSMPHFTVTNTKFIDLGRGRVLSIGCVGTPNEMVFLTEEEGRNVNQIVVLRNFDFDGKTYFHHLQNLVHSITGKELDINLYPATPASK